MGFFGAFRKKKQEKTEKELKEVIDSSIEAECRRVRQQIKLKHEEMNLARAQIDLERAKMELQDYIEEQDDFDEETPQGNNPDNMLQTLLMTMLTKNMMGSTQNSPSSSVPAYTHLPSVEVASKDQSLSTAGIELSNEDMEAIYEKIPGVFRDRIKTLDDGMLESVLDSYATKHLGQPLTPECKTKVISFLRSKTKENKRFGLFGRKV